MGYYEGYHYRRIWSEATTLMQTDPDHHGGNGDGRTSTA
jgi:hypothetical protein